MILRDKLLENIRKALKQRPAVVLLGPRQCGKTTLARTLVDYRSINYFDLEDPEHIGRLSDAKTSLARLKGLVVLDEVQNRPDLFPTLRVLCDRKPLPAKFLILGSASPALLHQSSETLAGRIELIDVNPFNIQELGVSKLERHWYRGGFPRSFLAKTDASHSQWLKDFVLTFLTRDIPQLGSGLPPLTLKRLWTMIAHYHGQIWNAAEPARSLGISETTVWRYLDLLEGIFMVRQLRPWHANLKKRQVKSPKVYIRDSGLFHYLLGIRSAAELHGHPKCGASWEGYVIEETLRIYQPDEVFFWATHNQAELDLLMIKDGVRIGVECKFSDAPKLTPSMQIALRDLKLDYLYVIYPGQHPYPLAPKIETIPIEQWLGGKMRLTKRSKIAQ